MAKGVTTMLRLRPRDGRKLHSKLVKAAKVNGRSLNSEIVARLLDSFNQVEIRAIVIEAVRQGITESMAARRSKRAKLIKGE